MADLAIPHIWTYHRVADAMQISTATVSKWYTVFSVGNHWMIGIPVFITCPTQTHPAVEQQILDLRAKHSD